MHRAVLGGGHGLQGTGAPASQLAALRGMMPQLRILLDGLHNARHPHRFPTIYSVSPCASYRGRRPALKSFVFKTG